MPAKRVRRSAREVTETYAWSAAQGQALAFAAGICVPHKVTLRTSFDGMTTDPHDAAGTADVARRLMSRDIAPLPPGSGVAERTRIASPAGDVAVEQLRAGDTILGPAGPLRISGPVEVRRFVCREQGSPAETWPVRIAAGAFGEGVPNRDLRVSPDQLLWVDRRLVPVLRLMNGTSIVQEQVEAVAYYVIPLGRRALVHADRLAVMVGGAPEHDARTVVAGIPREIAAATDELQAMHVASALVISRIRDGLEGRAIELGFGEGLDQTVPLRAAGAYDVRVEAAIRSVRLRSAAVSPPGDARLLGVAIGDIVLDGSPLQLDDPRLFQGFHPTERSDGPSFRWTNGDAVLLVGETLTPRTMALRVFASASEIFGGVS